MKYISLIAIVLTFALCSCNNHNDEPATTILLPVVESYLPATVAFNINDDEWIEKIKNWHIQRLIVNDKSELPKDPLGFSNAYDGIDFSKYTLLLCYETHNWTIDTYRNIYFRDNITKSYNWSVSIKSATIPDDQAEQWYFSRFSILVNKVPADAEINIYLSLGALNWGWE